MQENKINRVGEIHTTNEGYKVVIIEFFNSYNCTVQFEDGSILNNIQYNNLKLGNLKNKNHKSICGVGFLGNGEFLRKHNRESYRLWTSMLKKCYDKEYQAKNKYCHGFLVCDEWHNFQNFTKWFNDQNYMIDNYLVQNIIDPNNKIFEPNKCCFLPHELNSLFAKNYLKMGLYPEGVTYDIASDKYIAYFKGMIGKYSSEEEAFLEYKNYKENKVKKITEKYKNSITTEIYNVLINYKVK
jgi:hypothetical protein